ncbi:MAG TPA: roadblock/LC7 domain-containing protein [Gemmatimonadales bacterium]
MNDLPATPGRHGFAFLELGERLRQRGQFAAAASVASAGLSRYPSVADAHDLLARIRADQGDDAGAVAAWHAALECDPVHIGARKGLAFVAFRAHDFVNAERHLDLAATQAPHDASVLAALDRVRAAARQRPGDESPEPGDPGSGLILYDMQGLRLAGSIDQDSDDADADAAAATGAGLTSESVRVARLLQLGAVRHLIIEAADARVIMMPLTADAALLLHRGATTPLGRLLALGSRATVAARAWLERMA